jgi:hypothetical protein
MRQVLSLFLLLICTSGAIASDTTKHAPVSILRSNPQIDIGAGAGFVFPGAVESSFPQVRAFRAGMFLFNSNFNFNRKDHNLYFAVSGQFGLMPFSTSAYVPGPTPKPGKPLLDVRHDFLVYTLALIPSAQLQVPIGNTTKFCAGAGAGPMLMMHAHRPTPQRNIMLQANIGLLMEDKTGIGLRFLRPYEGIEESNPLYNCSYKVTGVLLDFRHRMAKPPKKTKYYR